MSWSGAAWFEMFDGIEQGLVELVAIRVPGADVAGVEPEDAEAEVATERRSFFTNLLSGQTNSRNGHVTRVWKPSALPASRRGAAREAAR